MKKIITLVAAICLSCTLHAQYIITECLSFDSHVLDNVFLPYDISQSDGYRLSNIKVKSKDADFVMTPTYSGNSILSYDWVYTKGRYQKAKLTFNSSQTIVPNGYVATFSNNGSVDVIKATFYLYEKRGIYFDNINPIQYSDPTKTKGLFKSVGRWYEDFTAPKDTMDMMQVDIMDSDPSSILHNHMVTNFHRNNPAKRLETVKSGGSVFAKYNYTPSGLIESIVYTSGNVVTYQWEKVTGIADDNGIASNQVTIYPNPASSTITVSGVADLNQKVTILNAVGELVLSHDLISNTIDVSSLTAGIYVLQIGNESIKLAIQ